MNKVFNITVGTKTKKNIHFDEGSTKCYYVDGKEMPNIRLKKDKSYEFNIDTPTHPFYIGFEEIGGRGSYSKNGGITKPKSSGTVEITVDKDEKLYYLCNAHRYMGTKVMVT